MKIKWETYDRIDSVLTDVPDVLDAVIEAGRAPCADQLVHENAICLCIERLQNARDRLRKDIKSEGD